MSKTALEEEGAIKILEIGLYVGQNAKGGGGVRCHGCHCNLVVQWSKRRNGVSVTSFLEDTGGRTSYQSSCNLIVQWSRHRGGVGHH